MIGVTIGVGEQWEQIATWSATRMTQTTGLRCEIIKDRQYDVVHPSWSKCRILDYFPDENEFLFFDADIVPVRHWNPAQLFESIGRAFCAVPDRNWPPTERECKNFNLPWPDCYINAGLLMFGREHGEIWERTWRKHPRFGSWLEQTALNVALVNSGIEVCRLPRMFNRLLDGCNPVAKAQAINLHAAGLPSRSIETMQALYRNTTAKPALDNRSPAAVRQYSLCP